jgi:hypothetical protein
MSNNYFLNKENLNMLWEVISDEEIFKFLSRDIQNKISGVFTANLKDFYESERLKNTNLIDINKKYIILILNYIKNNYPKQQPNKIKIHEELLPNTIKKELITYEDIQNEKKGQFEKDLSKLQEEFNSSMTIPVPSVPEFGDKNTDTPITEMEKIIKEMTAQRNYEVEQINKSYQQNNDWLKPQETSVKNDKNVLQQSSESSENPNKLRYIKIDNNEEITLNNYSPEKRKNVSWGENIEITEININDEPKINDDNIFKKLKRIEPKIEESYKPEEDRIKILEMEVKTINYKLDTLINLLKQNK